ncbi:DUF58 domain-containing protein [Alteromonas sediminis]|uniref:DUF58 domain-containing protein n=1 Tax=Alteromonas sediminis TaxID=2259342 RepID=A0A3N5YEY9_9ALTE|nr:DUF58 domain-containing protein [Alteromonas sediminis]RPJ68455.1 DUF58 domain-containing protein [Alteromonas sediminis]
MTVSTMTASLDTFGANGYTLSTQELLMYQSYAHLLDLKPKKQVRAQLSGGYLSKVKGRGMEFDEARHYQAGDDIRAIDWRVTARTGKTHTKVYREERERPVFVFCDFRSSMRFGTQWVLKSVQAAHLSSLIAWAGVKRGDKVGALLFDNHAHQEIKPKSRKRAVLSLTHGLVTMHDKPQQTSTQDQLAVSFEQACMRLRRLAKPGSLVYLISDFTALTDAAIQHIGELRRHCEVQAVHISDPLEVALPTETAAGTVTLFDGEQKQALNLSDKSVTKQYAQQRADYNARLQAVLSPNVAGVMRLSAGLPLTDQLIAMRGGKV